MSLESSFFAEIITNKSPNSVEFFHQQESGPVLLAYTWDNYVTICVLHFPELEHDISEFTYENLTDIDHGSSATKIAWSPKTSMLVHPVGIVFATIGLDCSLKYYQVNNKMEVSAKLLGSHRSFINDCSFEPSKGREVASVGDDKKCRIWDSDTCEEIMCLPLTSAGKSVKWNINDNGKLLVGEQNGTIRLYDVFSYLPLFTLSCLNASSVLTSVDWSLLDPQKIGCVAGKYWYIWDVSKGSIPESSGVAHSDSAHEFRFSNIDARIYSTRGRPENEFKVYFSHKDKIPVSTLTKIGNGLSWHNLLPMVAIGANRKVALYSLQ
ncbi:nucleoporin Nup37 [Hydra vulgaris]|uniref:Nucleoporin Nup37 n=1 Tax=Hydra vulgaris TaxID=6087 RepID=A0ABM4D463_HYDVU